MNDQQLETSARHACKLLGLDADLEVISYVPEEQCEVRALNWQILTPKVREQWAIMEGIEAAKCAASPVYDILNRK